ncbi:MAG: hypothetical protein K2X77_18410 [Candidatus Obscuribacterales bacterium]|jgi:hypothetical protein|nr:hypothetical protein [Candidatus Obscuribacterales bacterium]
MEVNQQQTDVLSDAALFGHYANLLNHVRGMVDALCPYDKEQRTYFSDSVNFGYCTAVDDKPVPFGLKLVDLAPNNIHNQHPQGRECADHGVGILLDSLYAAAQTAEFKLQNMVHKMAAAIYGEDFVQQLQEREKSVANERWERLQAYLKSQPSHLTPEQQEEQQKVLIAESKRASARRDARTLTRLAKTLGDESTLKATIDELTKIASEGESNDAQTTNEGNSESGRSDDGGATQTPEVSG